MKAAIVTAIMSFVSFVILLALKVSGAAASLTWFWVCFPLMILPGTIIVMLILTFLFAIFAIFFMCLIAVVVIPLILLYGWIEQR